MDYVFNANYAANPDYYYAYVANDIPYAGTLVAGYSGSGVVATSSKLNGPTGIGLSLTGQLFIADKSNNLVRKIASACVV